MVFREKSIARKQASSECDRPVHYFLCRVRHHPIAWYRFRLHRNYYIENTAPGQFVST